MRTYKIAGSTVAALALAAVAGCGPALTRAQDGPQPSAKESAVEAAGEATPTPEQQEQGASIVAESGPTEPTEPTETTPTEEPGGMSAPAKVGQTVTLSDDSGDLVVALTVEKVRVTGEPLSDNPILATKPDKNYVQVLVHAKTGPGAAALTDGSWLFNPLKWSVVGKDGFTYSTETMSGGDLQVMQSRNLKPGEQARGWVVFDAPKHGTVVMEMIAGMSKAAWTY